MQWECTVTGAVSAQNWKLGPVEMGRKGRISVDSKPVIVYTNRLPKWKLVSAKEWMESFEQMASGGQVSE